MPNPVKKVEKLTKKTENNPFCIVKHRENKKLNEKLQKLRKSKKYQQNMAQKQATEKNEVVMLYKYKTTTKNGKISAWSYMSMSKLNLHPYFSKMEIMKVIKITP